MKISFSHPWEVSVSEARSLQQQLRQYVDLIHVPNAIRTVAATDISYNRRNPRLYAALVVVRLPDFHVLQVLTGTAKATFPYVPGYLSFREIPVLLPLFRRLQQDFDVLLCDGQGLAHPRRFGLACHLGVLLNRPSIGCAKSLLVGHHAPVDSSKGSFRPLMDCGEQVGIVLRTRDHVKPVYVSPGHRMNFEVARRIVLQCVGRYRIPEPLRLAHIWVNKLRQADRVGGTS